MQGVFRPLQELVREDREPDVRVEALLLPMVEGAQVDFALQEMECRLHVGEHDVYELYLVVWKVLSSGGQMVAPVQFRILAVFRVVPRSLKPVGCRVVCHGVELRCPGLSGVC